MNNRKLILVFILLFFTIFNFYQVSAQGARVTKEDVTIDIDVGNEIITLEGFATRVFTPSSILTKVYVFTIKLSKNDLAKIQSKFGEYANSIEGIKGTIKGTDIELSGLGFLNKAGKLTIHLHSNGAGTNFPVGWSGF